MVFPPVLGTKVVWTYPRDYNRMLAAETWCTAIISLECLFHTGQHIFSTTAKENIFLNSVVYVKADVIRTLWAIRVRLIYAEEFAQGHDQLRVMFLTLTLMTQNIAQSSKFEAVTRIYKCLLCKTDHVSEHALCNVDNNNNKLFRN